MDSRVLIVVAIIVGAGLIGGLAAFLAEARSSDEPPLRTSGRFLMLGIIAAACVPLFLSLVRSQVTQGMFDNTYNDKGSRFPIYYESYLVFAGICLIAAFSARKFIDSVSKQVLQRLDEVQETAKGAAATAADAKQVAHEAVNEVEAADDNAHVPLPSDTGDSEFGPDMADIGPIDLTAAERKALEALSKRTYRTRTGIAEDSGVSRNRISEVLDSLHQKKLAMPTKSPTTGGSRWIITKRGEAALKS